jgi:uncharacterized protein (TIGR02246 family)
VDVIRQTTPASIADPGDAQRAQQLALQALLDEAAIRNLVSLYAIARDDHDIEAVLQCFAPDGVFISRGREITGHDALREWYLSNMRRNAFSHHIPHLCVVDFTSPDRASGIVTGNGEFAHPDGLILGAYRWYDDYVKIGGRWVFARRDHKYMYAVPVEKLASLGRDPLRIRMHGTEPIEAEWHPQKVEA